MNFRDVWEHLLDAIVPPRARSARMKERTLEDIPLTVMEHEVLGARVTTLMAYRDTRVQDLVRALKYDGSGHAAHLAAELLAEYLREEIASLRLFSQKPVLIVPLPLHASRARERGFNQIAIVLRQLPVELRDGGVAKLSEEALYRTKVTRPQTKLSRAERIKNVVGAFGVPDPSLVQHAHIFLIDDVATTGATLINAGKPLQAVGADVSLLALARA
ncbi:MAG TPA: hypothetical protein VN495_04340 [Candidatus Paceibacterota bacterium]|nr:hypothetical protein [Candidatus Paceibacterota bacterium]